MVWSVRSLNEFRVSISFQSDASKSNRWKSNSNKERNAMKEKIVNEITRKSIYFLNIFFNEFFFYKLETFAINYTFPFLRHNYCNLDINFYFSLSLPAVEFLEKTLNYTICFDIFTRNLVFP